MRGGWKCWLGWQITTERKSQALQVIDSGSRISGHSTRNGRHTSSTRLERPLHCKMDIDAVWIYCKRTIMKKHESVNSRCIHTSVLSFCQAVRLNWNCVLAIGLCCNTALRGWEKSPLCENKKHLTCSSSTAYLACYAIVYGMIRLVWNPKIFFYLCQGQGPRVFRASAHGKFPGKVVISKLRWRYGLKSFGCFICQTKLDYEHICYSTRWPGHQPSPCVIVLNLENYDFRLHEW